MRRAPIDDKRTDFLTRRSHFSLDEALFIMETGKIIVSTEGLGRVFGEFRPHFLRRKERSMPR